MRIASLGRNWFGIPAGLLLAASLPTLAASPNYKDVCASGCTYSSVQAAIDSITGSSATNVYTVFVDSGVLPTDTSITTSGKSYIDFVGRGIGVSIVRASATWFNNVHLGLTSPDFFNMSGSTNITISGLTIDALTNDQLLGPDGYNGVRLDNTDRVLVQTSEILGVQYAIWENANTSTNLIQIMSSKVRGVSYGVVVRHATWHIFSSDIRAVNDGRASGFNAAIGLAAGQGGAGGSNAANIAVWGCHIHGENVSPAQTSTVFSVRQELVPGSSLSIVGSTLHAKINSDYNVTEASHMVVGTIQGANKEVDVTGSEYRYETPTGMTQGKIGGLMYFDSKNVTVNLAGENFVSIGSGGSARADVVQSVVISTNMPTITTAGSRIASAVTTGSVALLSGLASQFNTLNFQKGVAVFPSSNTVTVTLPSAMPDTTYAVGLSANANETVYVSTKTTTSFTLKSSNASSTASVDWTVSR